MQPKKRHISEEEYFALDEAAPEGVRLEYDEGQLFLNGQRFDPDWDWERARAMAGASPPHNRITTSLVRILATGFRGRRCDVLSSDQRVVVSSQGKYTYPDVVVACEPSYEGVMLTNPELIIEVLSPGTMERDLGRKLDQYRQIASVEEYWVVWQDEVRLTRYYRTERGWGLETFTHLEQEARYLDVKVALQEVYEMVF